jgi:hypothetical protein
MNAGSPNSVVKIQLCYASRTIGGAGGWMTTGVSKLAMMVNGGIGTVALGGEAYSALAME